MLLLRAYVLQTIISRTVIEHWLYPVIAGIQIVDPRCVQTLIYIEIAHGSVILFVPVYVLFEVVVQAGFINCFLQGPMVYIWISTSEVLSSNKVFT